MIPGVPAGWEVVILLVVLLLLFGGSRLAGVGKGAGRAIREFKDEVRDDPKPVTRAKQAAVRADEDLDDELVEDVEVVEKRTVRRPGDPV